MYVWKKKGVTLSAMHDLRPGRRMDGHMDGGGVAEEKNAEWAFLFNEGSGIWEIMCAERRWLSGESLRGLGIY